MTDETRTAQEGPQETPDTGTAPEGLAETPAQPSEAAIDSALAGDLAALEAHLNKIESERAELKDRLLRMLAEAENLKKRTQREVADARKYAVTGFARDMLTVGDNFARALEKHGVKKLEPEGERFDPNLHQAMFEVPNADVPNGTVVQVMQAGYTIGDRVLRPAMVGISKGGGTATQAPAEPQPAAEPEAPDVTERADPGARIDRTV